jgi:hypothetical protein
LLACRLDRYSGISSITLALKQARPPSRLSTLFYTFGIEQRFLTNSMLSPSFTRSKDHHRY